MDAAYKKYTRPQSVKLNFIEKCSNMKVKHPKDYWLEYERKMLENINETRNILLSDVKIGKDGRLHVIYP